MSANIGELVDRIYREYLEPMDDLQPYTLLTSSGGGMGYFSRFL